MTTRYTPPSFTRGDRHPVLIGLGFMFVVELVILALFLSSRQANDQQPGSSSSGQVVSATEETPSPVATSPNPPTAASPRTPTTTATKSTRTTDRTQNTPSPKPPPAKAPAIQVDSRIYYAAPFQTLPIVGTYVESEGRTTLRVQHHDGEKWVNFPLPMVTGRSGAFTAHVELAAPGDYRIRIADPEAHIRSEVIVVHIV